MHRAGKHRALRLRLRLRVESDGRLIRVSPRLAQRLIQRIQHPARQHCGPRLACAIQRHVRALRHRRRSLLPDRHIALRLHPRQRPVGPPLQRSLLRSHRPPNRVVLRVGQKGLLAALVELRRRRRHRYRPPRRHPAHAHRRVQRQQSRIARVVRTRRVPRHRPRLELDRIVGRRQPQVFEIHQPAGRHVHHLGRLRPLRLCRGIRGRPAAGCIGCLQVDVYHSQRPDHARFLVVLEVLPEDVVAPVPFFPVEHHRHIVKRKFAVGVPHLFGRMNCVRGLRSDRWRVGPPACVAHHIHAQLGRQGRQPMVPQVVRSPKVRSDHQQQEDRASHQPHPQSCYPIAHPSALSIFSPRSP